MSELIPVDKIKHVDELLAYSGEEFVDMAYRVILRRNADAQGRAHYLESLKSGDGKDAVIHALYVSVEYRGAHRGEEIGGLGSLVESWLRRRRPRTFLSSIAGLPDSLRDLQALERKLNRLEYAVTAGERIVEYRAATEMADGADQTHEPVAAGPKRGFEVRRGRSAFLTVLNFEASVRASPMSKVFVR